MAISNIDANFDAQNVVLEPPFGLEIGEVIYIDENQLDGSEDKLEVPAKNVKKILKPKKPRADVYKFFEWDKENNKWKCCTCNTSYAPQESGSTGSLHNHMKRKHESIYTRDKIAATQIENRVITKEIFRQKVIKFMVCSDQAFTIVEDPFFIDLIDYCAGGNEVCKLFSAKTAKDIIDKLFLEHKAKATKILQNNAGKISFIIDCWTSSNQHPFQGVIARWVSDDWELHNAVIDLAVLHGSHTGENIAKSFWAVLVDYGLVEKLLSVTTDNASNMDTMFEELEKLFEKYGITWDSKDYRVRCFAHILNLASRAMINAVGDGDKETYPSDDESEGEDSIEKESSKQLPVVAKMRKGVVAIRRSPQRREMFQRQCNVANIRHKNLLRDVRTRFNATLTMLERSKEMHSPFDMTLSCIPKLRKYVLSNDEWTMIDELIELLSPFKEATVMLSNEHSPTLSRISSVYQLIFNHLEKYAGNDEEVPSKRGRYSNQQERPEWLLNAADNGWEKLKKYYPTSDGLVHIVATDPRYKLVWYKATGWPKQWIDFARKSVTELYKIKYLSAYSSKGVEKDNQSESNSPTTNNFKPASFSDLFNKQMRNFQKHSTDDDLKRYLTESVVDPDKLVKERTGVNGVLGWWKIHEKEFPVLSTMAKDFLSASGTGIPVERLFSSGPDILTPKRQCLTAESIRKLVCLKSWLKAKSFNDVDLKDALLYKLGVVPIEPDEQAQLR